MKYASTILVKARENPVSIDDVIESVIFYNKKTSGLTKSALNKYLSMLKQRELQVDAGVEGAEYFHESEWLDWCGDNDIEKATYVTMTRKAKQLGLTFKKDGYTRLSDSFASRLENIAKIWRSFSRRT